MPSANDVFPVLHACARLAVNTDDDTVYDVQFYPYGTVDDDQIFAVVTGVSIIVCRPKLDTDQGFEILAWLQDEQPPPRPIFNSLVWTKDPETRKPWLCVCGHFPQHIKILDVESSSPVRTLSGHGKGINALAVSPLCTSLLASGAEDCTIRLWNLEAKYRKQPCVALLAGEGHKQPILAINFHPNGKWLLSGGIDTAVCLWAVPSIEDLEQRCSPQDGRPKEPLIVFYPSFYTKELHSNYVDCLEFYGDLIISKAARDPGHKLRNTNEILIWKIDGFDSEEPAPSEPPIPVPGKQTRSAFEHNERRRGFQRLLTLALTHCDRFYHRFGLLHEEGMRPLLAFGNQQGLFTFWDLQRLDEGLPTRAKKTKAARKNIGQTGGFDGLDGLRRSDNNAEGTDSSSDPSSAAADREFTLDDRFKPIEPHHKRRLIEHKLHDKKNGATSQIAFSPDGTWMVGVGDWGMMSIWHRDKSVIGSRGSREDGG